MAKHRIYTMSFARVYPLYVAKAERKGRTKAESTDPYDWTRTYRAGQTMKHPIWGSGEVTALIEPRKIDVLFADRIRRLIHSRPEA